MSRRTLSRQRNDAQTQSWILEKLNLDLLVKIPIGLVSLFYVVGIFVQGFYYGQFGINSLNLLKLSYILAGFWSVVYLVTPGLILGFIISLVCPKRLYLGQQKLKQIPKLKLASYFGLLLLIVFGTIFFYNPFRQESETQAMVVGSIPPTITSGVTPSLFQDYLYLSIFFTILIIILSLAVLFTIKNVENIIGKSLILFILTGMLLSGLLTSIQTFSTQLYGEIPVFVGGGKLRDVIIWVKAEESEVERFGLDEKPPKELSNDSTKSDSSDKQEEIKSDPNNKDEEKAKETVLEVPAKLILEASEGYYLLSYRNETVFLPKEKVLYFIYKPQPILLVRPVR
jgi:hypothetical protein